VTTCAQVMSAVVQKGKKIQVSLSRTKDQKRQPAHRSCLLSSRRARRDRSVGQSAFSSCLLSSKRSRRDMSVGLKVRGYNPRQSYSYLCTYDLYSPMHNVLDACISMTRASRWGLGPGNREFFGPYEMESS
jgi:hypothetical protein